MPPCSTRVLGPRMRHLPQLSGRMTLRRVGLNCAAFWGGCPMWRPVRPPYPFRMVISDTAREAVPAIQ